MSHDWIFGIFNLKSREIVTGTDECNYTPIKYHTHTDTHTDRQTDTHTQTQPHTPTNTHTDTYRQTETIMTDRQTL